MAARHFAAAPLALAVALVLLAGSASANGRQLRCGATLTHSVRLTADLRACPGPGLIIGADGITVDLGGHTIDGGGAPAGCDVPEVQRSGIDDVRGYDRVTIVNGTIQGFDNGVGVGSDDAGMSDSRLAGLTVRDNRLFGIRTGSGAGPAATSGNRIEGNVISGARCNWGILVLSGERNRIVGNRVDGPGSGIVICCQDGGHNTVTGNRVSGTQDDGIFVLGATADRIEGNVLTDLGGAGVAIRGDASDTVVRGNSVARAGVGVVLESCCDESGSPGPTGIEVAGNTLTATRDGIVLFESDSDSVRRNVISDATCGDPTECGWGIALDGASDALVSDNVVAGKESDGIVVGVAPEFDRSPRPVSGNRIVRNVVRNSSLIGIRVDAAARATELRGNTSVGNGADGIDVLAPDPATILADNTALRNGAYGIEAAPGVTDGGGNRARGNGNPAQCAGVAC